MLKIYFGDMDPEKYENYIFNPDSFSQDKIAPITESMAISLIMLLFIFNEVLLAPAFNGTLQYFRFDVEDQKNAFRLLICRDAVVNNRFSCHFK